MPATELRKTIRTVQLGFYRHDSSDAIADLPLPKYDDGAETPMPTQETSDYLTQGPRLYPRIGVGDAKYEVLARCVLADLFWMCCCKGAAAATVTPVTRRCGQEILRGKIIAARDTVIASGGYGARDSAQTWMCIVELLGGTLPRSEVALWAAHYRYDDDNTVCDLLSEPTLGDCTSTHLEDAADKFAARASRGMHFLGRGARLPEHYQDVLVGRLCDGCYRLIGMCSSSGDTLRWSNKWIVELLTGVPRGPMALASVAANTTRAVGVFGVAKQPTPTPPVDEKSEIEVALAAAIGRGSGYIAVEPAPPREPRSPREVAKSNGLTTRSLSLRTCSPALQSWFSTPKSSPRVGTPSIRYTVGTPTPRSDVTHSEFAALSAPIAQANVGSPRRPRPPTKGSSQVPMGDAHGRRDLLQLQKATRCTRVYTLAMVDGLRAQMHGVLHAITSEHYLNAPDLVVSELERVKGLLDDAFNNGDVFSNLGSANRRDLLERTVFLARLIGEKRRIAAEARKANGIWATSTGSI